MSPKDEWGRRFGQRTIEAAKSGALANCPAPAGGCRVIVVDASAIRERGAALQLRVPLPSCSMKRNLRTVSSSTSSALIRVSLMVSRPTESRPTGR